MIRRVLNGVLLTPLRFYRRFISPGIAPRCRYYPTCSTYAVTSLREFGPVRGTVLAVWRVLRCNPFSDGGVDYPAGQHIFKRCRRSPKVSRP